MLKQGIYEHIINQETERQIQKAEKSGLVCVQQAIDDADNAIEQLNKLSSDVFEEFEEKYQESSLLMGTIY